MNRVSKPSNFTQENDIPELQRLLAALKKGERALSVYENTIKKLDPSLVDSFKGTSVEFRGDIQAEIRHFQSQMQRRLSNLQELNNRLVTSASVNATLKDSLQRLAAGWEPSLRALQSVCGAGDHVDLPRQHSFVEQKAGTEAVTKPTALRKAASEPVMVKKKLSFDGPSKKAAKPIGKRPPGMLGYAPRPCLSPTVKAPMSEPVVPVTKNGRPIDAVALVKNRGTFGLSDRPCSPNSPSSPQRGGSPLRPSSRGRSPSPVLSNRASPARMPPFRAESPVNFSRGAAVSLGLESPLAVVKPQSTAQSTLPSSPDPPPPQRHQPRSAATTGGSTRSTHDTHSNSATAACNSHDAHSNNSSSSTTSSTRNTHSNSTTDARNAHHSGTTSSTHSANSSSSTSKHGGNSTSTTNKPSSSGSSRSSSSDANTTNGYAGEQQQRNRTSPQQQRQSESPTATNRSNGRPFVTENALQLSTSSSSDTSPAISKSRPNGASSFPKTHERVSSFSKSRDAAGGMPTVGGTPQPLEGDSDLSFSRSRDGDASTENEPSVSVERDSVSSFSKSRDDDVSTGPAKPVVRGLVKQSGWELFDSPEKDTSGGSNALFARSPAKRSPETPSIPTLPNNEGGSSEDEEFSDRSLPLPGGTPPRDPSREKIDFFQGGEQQSPVASDGASPLSVQHSPTGSDEEGPIRFSSDEDSPDQVQKLDARLDRQAESLLQQFKMRSKASRYVPPRDDIARGLPPVAESPTGSVTETDSRCQSPSTGEQRAKPIEDDGSREGTPTCMSTSMSASSTPNFPDTVDRNDEAHVQYLEHPKFIYLKSKKGELKHYEFVLGKKTKKNTTSYILQWRKLSKKKTAGYVNMCDIGTIEQGGDSFAVVLYPKPPLKVFRHADNLPTLFLQFDTRSNCEVYRLALRRVCGIADEE